MREQPDTASRSHDKILQNQNRIGLRQVIIVGRLSPTCSCLRKELSFYFRQSLCFRCVLSLSVFVRDGIVLQSDDDLSAPASRHCHRLCSVPSRLRDAFLVPGLSSSGRSGAASTRTLVLHAGGADVAASIPCATHVPSPGIS